MRRPTRLLVSSALILGLAFAGGCKRTQSSSDTSPGSTSAGDDGTADKPPRVRRKPGLPRPLRLPASSPILVHIGDPLDALADLQTYAPQLPSGNALLQRGAAQLPGGGALEAQLAGMVDLQRAWDVALVEGELIAYVPIHPARLDAVATLLSDKPPVGRFGAVDLQRGAAPGPTLAWLDREAEALTLASTERGLATGRHLARQYGKDHALRLELRGAEARTYAPAFDLESLQLRGAGLHQFEIEAEGVPAEVLAQLDDLQPGALTGLLESPHIAAGASSRYAHYERDVRNILSNVKRQVDRQSFLVKGTLQDLSRRLGSVMRSWDGRTMAGVGPRNHVLVAFGSADNQKMGGALFHLMTGVIDNLELARSIGFAVPKIRMRRNHSQAAGSNISAFAVENARRYLPPEAASLLTEQGDLRITVAFPTRASAGLVVLGPSSPEVLAQWLEDVADATPGSKSTGDFIAATLAVEPEALVPLVKGGRLDVPALLGLQATRDPTQVTMTRDGQTVKLRVTGPETVHRKRRMGAGRLGAGPARAPAPANGKPARTSTGPAKPVR